VIVVFEYDHARIPAKLAWVGRDQPRAMEELDPTGIDADGQRKADQVRGHGVAIGGECDHAFATDLDGVKQAVVGGHAGERTELGLFGRQQDTRDLLGRIGPAHLIDLIDPARAFVLQLSIVVEGSAGQEGALDESGGADR
jgi:hypothetical protein